MTPEPTFSIIWRNLLVMVLMFVLCGTLSATDRYVSLSGGHISPYTNWANAATGIQYAITACSSGDVVWVTNGTYDVGTTSNYISDNLLINRIAITNAVALRSANNDPTNTIIKGQGPCGTTNAVRGVFMAENTQLIGFTVRDGTVFNNAFSEKADGAGIYCLSSTVISNCIICNNECFEYGGGIKNGTLYNCMLINNISHEYGGGAYDSVLYSCILTNNKIVPVGGGNAGGGIAGGGSAYNCLLIGNVAGLGAAASGNGYLYNCTIVTNLGGTSRPFYNCIFWDNGIGETTNPLFVNLAGGNYRLSESSPFRNVGTNGAWTIGVRDLDGNQRIWPRDGTVDMGAYEFNSQPSYPVILIISGADILHISGTSLQDIRGIGKE